MIEVNTEQVEQYAADLKQFAAKALPYAARETLNSAAFAARDRGQMAIRESMVLRNRWTERSVRVDRATSLEIDVMQSAVGSTVDYLKTQEEGGIVAGGSGASKPIATSYSAGQGAGEKRTRLPRAANTLRRITLQKGSAVAGGRAARRQRNAAAVREAGTSGNPYVYLDMGKRKGIFKVIGPRSKKFKEFKVRMVWDMSRASVVVKPRPWLEPASDAVARDMPALYEKALLYQLKRHRVLNYGRY